MPENDKGAIHHVKDKFAREMLSDKNLALEFFKQFVPELDEGADWSTLEQQPGSVITEDYQSKYSDVLYAFQRKNRETLVYVLIEHKSQQDHWTLLYLLQLMVQIWARWLNQNGSGQKVLPLIVPLILHQSSSRWSAPIAFEEYFTGVEDALTAHIPRFSSRLVDLAEVQLETIGNWLLEAMVSLMKVINEGGATEWLESHIKVLAEEVFKRMGPGRLVFFLNYLAQSKGHVDFSTIRRIAAKISDKEFKNNVMTWAESLKQEAREEGLVIGQIITLREVLGLPEMTSESFSALSLAELKIQVQELKARLRQQGS